ncbi:MAG: hypothetical protein IT359_04360 [Gemmatimonadaceae bacterium]|nr:hypothetical protein [Gemmatimonadaceae bacterium]
MFEHRSEPLIPRREFYQRLAYSTAVGSAIVAISLGVGMAGYHGFEGMPWLDAFLNASMLLGGMGPVTELHTSGGKLFAGVFALYCGLAVILVAGITLSPVVHRFFHKLHADVEDRD